METLVEANMLCWRSKGQQLWETVNNSPKAHRTFVFTNPFELSSGEEGVLCTQFVLLVKTSWNCKSEENKIIIATRL